MAALAAGCATRASGPAPEDTYEVGHKDLRDVLTQVGTVQPVRAVEIKSEATGRIDKISVIEGQRVRSGDTLLSIDPRLTVIQKKKLHLALEAARLERSKAEREHDRVIANDAVDTISSQRLDELRDAVRLASIREREILLQIEEADEQLSKTVIKAPLSGVVTNLYVEEGEIAASVTAGVQGGTSVARMIDIENLEVVAQVSEVDYVRLRQGQAVTLRPEAFPNQRTQGRISFLAMNAKRTTEKELGAFEVRITIDAIVPGIMPGSNVSVDFVMLEKPHVLAVPCHFVVEESGSFYVDVLQRAENGPVERTRRPLQLGVTDFKFYEVLSGLDVGERLAAPPTP